MLHHHSFPCFPICQGELPISYSYSFRSIPLSHLENLIMSLTYATGGGVTALGVVGLCMYIANQAQAVANEAYRYAL